MDKPLILIRNIFQGIVSILLSLIMIIITPIIFVIIPLIGAFEKHFYWMYCWWLGWLWCCMSMQMVGGYDD